MAAVSIGGLRTSMLISKHMRELARRQEEWVLPKVEGGILSEQRS